MKSVREVVEGAIEVGRRGAVAVRVLAGELAAAQPEVSALMSLLEEYIQREADDLDEHGVRVRVLGELDRLTPRRRARPWPA